jgi:hypothetical protein
MAGQLCLWPVPRYVAATMSNKATYPHVQQSPWLPYGLGPACSLPRITGLCCWTLTRRFSAVRLRRVLTTRVGTTGLWHLELLLRTGSGSGSSLKCDRSSLQTHRPGRGRYITRKDPGGALSASASPAGQGAERNVGGRACSIETMRCANPHCFSCQASIQRRGIMCSRTRRCKQTAVVGE